MKVLSTLLIVMLCSAAGVAQETLPEPQFADLFFRLDAGKLIPPERQTATIRGKASGFIVMSLQQCGCPEGMRLHYGDKRRGP